MKFIVEQANAKAGSGDLVGAVALLVAATSSFPNADDLYYRIGMLYARMGKLKKSIEFLDKAILLNSLSSEIHYNLGLVLSLADQPEGALAAYQKALELAPEDIDTLVNMSGILNRLSAYEQALVMAEKAIELKGSVAQAWFNKASALKKLNKFEEALSSYNNCINLNPNYAEAWAAKGQVLAMTGRHQDAIRQFDQALEIIPHLSMALKDKGDSLHALFEFELAISAYQSALKIQPDFQDAWNNLGVALQDIGATEQAINAYKAALKFHPNHVDAWNNLGAALQILGDLQGSLHAYQKVLDLDQTYPFAYGSYCFLKLSICSWDGIDRELIKLEESTGGGIKAVQPFFMLSMSHDESTILSAAQTWSDALLSQKSPESKAVIRERKLPIRLGYFSADFRLHAVAHLVSGLLESHDKTQFEIYGFAFGPQSSDDASSRIAKTFHRFIDIRNMPDEDVAQLARELEIDIAIDLTGLTQYSRPGIFMVRAAPIQVNYLGYPGTVGFQDMDYLIADKTVLPPEHEKYYIEKIVYLPDTYQANDSKREISNAPLERDSAGLPKKGFVFCCFNNLHKITPSTFDVWMRILSRVEDSVLWLLEGNPAAVKNLQREARARGVDPTRLVFAPRATLSMHLARHRLADLFIDSLPYGAHTTASDALWAGLPVLTCLGKSFVGRVAASLLCAIKLPELIAKNFIEFEEMAVELAHDPEKLQGFKKRLELNRFTTPLFDTQLFTRNIERAYQKMMERHQMGLPPDHLDIESS